MPDDMHPRLAGVKQFAPPRWMGIAGRDDVIPHSPRAVPLIDVFLDGVRQDRVVEYHCDGGWVLACAVDDTGRLLVRRGIAVEVRSFGRVDVRWR